MPLLKKFALLVGSAAVAVFGGWIAVPSFSRSARAQSPQKVTHEIFDQWMTELSNWGRWGKDDQMGAVNLITPAKRKQALALVKEGVSFSMARDAETEKAVDNPAPIVHQMTRVGVRNQSGDFGGSADTFFISYHGYAHTHMDTLCHFFYKGKMYNGYPMEEVTDQGAGKNSILNFKNGIITRGVLMDIARLKGMDYLEPGTAIYPEDLDAWEKKAHLKVGPGDVVFIRTGRWARRDVKGPWSVQEAGLAGL